MGPGATSSLKCLHWSVCRADVPLFGARVVASDSTAVAAGNMQLADLGAAAMKPQASLPAGDPGRYATPYQDGANSLFVESDRSKRCSELDLRRAESPEIPARLVAAADVVFVNLGGRQPRWVRIRYEALKCFDPRVVCCSVIGFGPASPGAEDARYDYRALAVSRRMTLTGDPDGPPRMTGRSRVDVSADYVAAWSIASAVLEVRDGVGGSRDASRFETARPELYDLRTWMARSAQSSSWGRRQVRARASRELPSERRCWESRHTRFRRAIRVGRGAIQARALRAPDIPETHGGASNSQATLACSSGDACWFAGTTYRRSKGTPTWHLPSCRLGSASLSCRSSRCPKSGTMTPSFGSSAVESVEPTSIVTTAFIRPRLRRSPDTSRWA